jgi:hypothetical protein
MKRKIIIDGPNCNLELQAELFGNSTSEEVLEHFPITSKVKLWGEEIYFDTGIDTSDEGATVDVDIGDLAYWPEGKCLCIFFGKTPLSTTDKPVPASPVVVIGKVSLEKEKLRKVKSGSKIRIE